MMRRYGLSDPNPFFTNLSSAPFQGNMMVGPHVYPPSITNAQVVRSALLITPVLVSLACKQVWIC